MPAAHYSCCVLPGVSIPVESEITSPLAHHARQWLPKEFPLRFIISSGERILTAEKSTPPTAIDAMHDLNLNLGSTTNEVRGLEAVIIR
jgi:hypothetical protein